MIFVYAFLNALPISGETHRQGERRLDCKLSWFFERKVKCNCSISVFSTNGLYKASEKFFFFVNTITGTSNPYLSSEFP
jgi:hypothetical protein